MKIGRIPQRSQRAVETEQRYIRTKLEKAAQRTEFVNKITREENELNRESKLLLCLWILLDKHLEELEYLQDLHTSKSPYEDWDDVFVYCTEKIPKLREVLDDLWCSYINIDRPEYHEWL